MWRRLSGAYLSAPDQPAWLGAFDGFLECVWAIDPAFGEEIETEALGEPALRRIFGFLTGRRPMDGVGVDRAIEALSSPDVNVAMFDRIVWSETAAMNDADRVRLLWRMLKHDGGARAVIDALGMLHYVERSRRRRWPDAVREVGVRAVSDVLRTTPPHSDHIIDHGSAAVVAACVTGDDDGMAAIIIEALAARAARYYGTLYDFAKTVRKLGARAPHRMLDFVVLDYCSDGDRSQILSCSMFGEKSLLAEIEPEPLVEWCAADREGGRWKKAARSVGAFVIERTEVPPRLNPQARALLAAAPDPICVVDALAADLFQVWSASEIEARIVAFGELASDTREPVRDAINRHLLAAKGHANAARERDRRRDAGRDKSFE